MAKSLILVHGKDGVKKKKQSRTMKKWYKKNGERHRKKMRQWFRDNPDWYKKYRKDNPEKIRKAFERYRKSPKGRKAIKRYEQSPQRKASKAFWNFKQRLRIKVENGEISKYEMNKRIKIRLKEKPI